MQLDKTYIAIRERDILDILDLSLHVFRVFFFPLLMSLAVGMLPFCLLLHWWLGGFDPVQLQFDDSYYEFEWRMSTAYWTAFGVVLLAPLATSAVTLFLGQAMFSQRAEPVRVGRDFVGSLPQLILFQVILRPLLLFPHITAFIPYAIWPYLNEIILLERNPLLKSKKNRITTMRRSSALHGSSFGDLFARWLAGTAFAATMAFLLLTAIWGTKFWMTGSPELSRLTFLVIIEISCWLTAGYFAVVRFLNYLDLRIRREGWEVELKMRAEAARMAGQLT
jgi:hypothetical protein